jgi:hypothetical protein
VRKTGGRTPGGALETGGVIMPALPGQDEILAALPLRPRPGLRIGPDAGKGGALVILEEPPDPEDYGADAIIGLAVPRQGGGWYLGCIECQDEIGADDSGMCQRCREDAAFRDLQRQAAQEADTPEDW